jgi:hypothetical protein
MGVYPTEYAAALNDVLSNAWLLMHATSEPNVKDR